MSILDRFEQKVEGAINGVFSKFGSKDLKPVDLMVSLRNKMDESVVNVKNGRRVSANVFKITLSTPDFDKIETWGTQEFANELASSLEDHSMAEIYSLLGDIVVTFEEDVEAAVGEYVISAEAKRLTDDERSVESSSSSDSSDNSDSAWLGAESGARIASNASIESEGDFPSVVIDDVRYVLANPVTVLGRGSNSDIIVNDSSISRRHLELRVTGSSTIATDLQSTNGMFVEGNKTKAVSLMDGNVITIGKTIIQYFDAKNKVKQSVSGDAGRIDSANSVNDNNSKHSEFFSTDDVSPAAMPTYDQVSPVQTPAPQTPAPTAAEASAPKSALARLADSANHSASQPQMPSQPSVQVASSSDDEQSVLQRPLNINPFDELELSEPVNINNTRRGE